MKRRSHKLKVGYMVVLRHEAVLADDSMMPLTSTVALNIDLVADHGSGAAISSVAAWMGYCDTGIIVEIAGDELAGYRYTPIVRLLTSHSPPGLGWIDSIYLRGI